VATSLQERLSLAPDGSRPNKSILAEYGRSAEKRANLTKLRFPQRGGSCRHNGAFGGDPHVISRVLTGFTLAFALLILAPTVAQAHVVYGDGVVFDGYQNGVNQDLYAYAEVSHGADNQGYQKGTYHAYLPFNNEARDNTHQKAFIEFLYRSSDGGQTWGDWCTQWGWFWSRNYYQAKAWTYSSAPCGPGTYGLITRVCAQVVDGGTWYCGNQWSGPHYWPTGSQTGPTPPSQVLKLFKSLDNLKPTNPGLVPYSPIAFY
jgi:hypothetical protein